LVVDDDFNSLESMFEYLNIVFETVYKAQDAKEALTLIKK